MNITNIFGEKIEIIDVDAAFKEVSDCLEISNGVTEDSPIKWICKGSKQVPIKDYWQDLYNKISAIKKEKI